MAEGMTVTELADTVGMTPRNIRAYQSRGLLFPPTISGRVAGFADDGSLFLDTDAGRVALSVGEVARVHAAPPAGVPE